MINKNVFINKFFQKNPNFPSQFLHLYYHNEDEVYAILCNFNESGKISPKDIQNIKNLSNNPDIITKCCEMFEKNPEIIELIGDFILKTGKMNPTVDELVSFLQNSKTSTGKVVLSDSNNIVVYKLNQNSELMNDVAFKMTFLIETIKNKKQITKRLFIQDAESYDRGKGIYTEILNNFLPKICYNNRIPYIVLNASAYDSNSAERGGQEKLEQFYKKLGYFKVKENYDKDFMAVKESDFDEDMPVYCKVLDREREYDDFSK